MIPDNIFISTNFGKLFEIVNIHLARIISLVIECPSDWTHQVKVHFHVSHLLEIEGKLGFVVKSCAETDLWSVLMDQLVTLDAQHV